jgi:hypothetical protein
MTFDELEQKIHSIKKRGLNIMLENELITDVRKRYHDGKMAERITAMSERVRRNNKFLGKLHGEYCSWQKIKSYMGIEYDPDLNKILYENQNIYSLRMAYGIAEFYGIPMELLLFTDLEANEEIIRKQYPALIRQSRN